MRQRGKEATRRCGIKLMWATTPRSYLQNLGHMVDPVSVLSHPRGNGAGGIYHPKAEFGSCSPEDCLPALGPVPTRGSSGRAPAAREGPWAEPQCWTGLGNKQFCSETDDQRVTGAWGPRGPAAAPTSTWRIPRGPWKQWYVWGCGGSGEEGGPGTAWTPARAASRHAAILGTLPAPLSILT